jgi:hypothetical protein
MQGKGNGAPSGQAHHGRQTLAPYAEIWFVTKVVSYVFLALILVFLLLHGVRAMSFSNTLLG